jgi:hypothetical protein
MTEHDLTPLLNRLASTFPDRPAPLPELMVAAGAARRRRTRVRVAVGVASLALVGSAAAAVALRPNEGLTVTDSVELPVAPVGQRLVGVGRVVLPVPDGWGTQYGDCVTDSVADLWFRSAARGSCISDFRAAGEPAVGFLDLDSDAGEQAAAFALEPDFIDGVPVLRGPGCPDTGADTAACLGPSWSKIVAVPSEDVVIVVPRTDPASPSLDALRILPEGFTTVPSMDLGTTNGAAGNLLLKAGLTYREAPEPELPTGRAATYGTDPAPGTIVPLGTEVTVLLEPYRQPLTPKQVTAVQAIVEDRLDDEPGWLVSDVWARSDTGTVVESAQVACTSGELLRISLVGSFDIVTSGGLVLPSTTPDPDPQADTVTEVRLVADAVTREICSTAVRTGTYTPDPAYTQLLDLQ